MRRYGESRAHEKAKEQVANIARSYGWLAWVEYPFECETEKGPRTYYADIYAQNFCFINGARIDGGNGNISLSSGKSVKLQSGMRRIIVEIQGRKGHASRGARQKDDLRIEDIRTGWGPIEYFEVFLGTMRSPNDIRNWSEADITEELGL